MVTAKPRFTFNFPRGLITLLLVLSPNFIFALMTRSLHLTSLESPEVDTNPTLNVVIAYEDLETGKRAKKIYDFLVENLGHDCQFTNQMWKFELLGIPKLREMAAQDAMMADIVIISCHGAELPSDFKAWVELWAAEPNHPIALVALFDYDNHPRVAEARSYLADVARRGFFSLQRNSSIEEQTFSTLATALQRDTTFPHWEINE